MAYILPATFIGRMMGERAMKSPMKQVSFSLKLEGSETADLKVTLSKPGQIDLELLDTTTADGGPEGSASLAIVEGRITPSGDFSVFPGNPELWSIFLLQVLDAKDGDAVEEQWNQLAVQMGLSELTTSITRCESVVCFQLDSKAADADGAVLHVGRTLFRVLGWQPITQAPGAKAPRLQLHDYESSLAPHWVPRLLEFIDVNGASLRYESMDVEFIPPVESKD